jgi:type I restriction enzyme S subunit
LNLKAINKGQNENAETIYDMNLEIGSLEMKKEKYKSIKVGMMQELLTGKTGLI